MSCTTTCEEGVRLAPRAAARAPDRAAFDDVGKSTRRVAPARPQRPTARLVAPEAPLEAPETAVEVCVKRDLGKSVDARSSRSKGGEEGITPTPRGRP